MLTTVAESPTSTSATEPKLTLTLQQRSGSRRDSKGPSVKLFKTIREQAPETWQAGAWALERRYPEVFAKPEAQLNIVATAQAAALGPSNVVVIGPERAKILASRHEQLRARSIALLDA